MAVLKYKQKIENNGNYSYIIREIPVIDNIYTGYETGEAQDVSNEDKLLSYNTPRKTYATGSYNSFTVSVNTTSSIDVIPKVFSQTIDNNKNNAFPLQIIVDPIALDSTYPYSIENDEIGNGDTINYGRVKLTFSNGGGDYTLTPSNNISLQRNTFNLANIRDTCAVPSSWTSISLLDNTNYLLENYCAYSLGRLRKGTMVHRGAPNITFKDNYIVTPSGNVSYDSIDNDFDDGLTVTFAHNAGYYENHSIKIESTGLKPDNILQDVTILGVEGNIVTYNNSGNTSLTTQNASVSYSAGYYPNAHGAVVNLSNTSNHAYYTGSVPSGDQSNIIQTIPYIQTGGYLQIDAGYYNTKRIVVIEATSQGASIPDGYQDTSTATQNPEAKYIKENYILYKKSGSITGTMTVNNNSTLSIPNNLTNCTITNKDSSSLNTIIEKTISNGYYENSKIQISSANLKSQNIKTGVTILGVTGNYDGPAKQPGSSLTISTKDETITIPTGNYSSNSTVSISTTEQNNLIPGNIRSGVSILGVDGSYVGVVAMGVITEQYNNYTYILLANGILYFLNVSSTMGEIYTLPNLTQDQKNLVHTLIFGSNISIVDANFSSFSNLISIQFGPETRYFGTLHFTNLSLSRVIFPSYLQILNGSVFVDCNINTVIFQGLFISSYDYSVSLNSSALTGCNIQNLYCPWSITSAQQLIDENSSSTYFLGATIENYNESVYENAYGIRLY